MTTDLSYQDKQILSWRLEGLSQKQIGEHLQVSHTTIQRYEKKAMEKCARIMDISFPAAWRKYKQVLRLYQPLKFARIDHVTLSERLDKIKKPF